MKKGFITGIAAAMIAATLAGCYGDDEKNGGSGALLLLMGLSTQDMIATMSQSAVDAASDSMSDIENSGVTGVSRVLQAPAEWRRNPTLSERLARLEGCLFSAISATADTITCPGGGSVDVTDTVDTWYDSAKSDFYVTRDFDACRGPYGLFRADGETLLSWTGLKTGVTGAAKLQTGAGVGQAPVTRVFTRISNGNYITTAGNMADVISNGTISGNIAHRITWTLVSGDTRNFTVETDLTRKGYTAAGTETFEHRVYTISPVDVTANVSGGVRTINSGTVRVDYLKAGITLDVMFNGVTMPIDNCVPTSGTADITVSGARTGSGTLTYHGDGSVSYTYSGSRRSGSGTFYMNGCQ